MTAREAQGARTVRLCFFLKKSLTKKESHGASSACARLLLALSFATKEFAQ